MIPVAASSQIENSSTQKACDPVEWFWIRSGPGDFAFNMGLDEALLEAAPRFDHPVLRFYRWTEPAASFGYFQRYRDVEQLTMLRPLVRRPTGGGIVPHDADWTYSLIFPPSNEWYHLAAKESYHQVHFWIQRAFSQLGVETELAQIRVKTQPGQCFVGHEQSDLLLSGAKIAGAAQRRRRDGLLIQGSVQPPPSLCNHRNAWEQAMLDVSTPAHGAKWKSHPHENFLMERAMELARTKYAQPSYNMRR